MGWETFKGRNRKQIGQPAMTLSKGGSIGLNSAIVKDVLGDYRHATLLFDKQKHLVGVKLLKSPDSESYPIHITPNESYAMISGIAFMKAYGIFPKETKVFDATFDDKNKIIAADVSELAGSKKK
jgi:hypothetical protein